MSEPRPTKLTPEMRFAVAHRVAEDLARDGCIERDEIGDAAEQIAQEGHLGIDGYELARALDSRCYWSPDARMVELLDGFTGYAMAAVEDAEKAWAETTHLDPPYPVGTRVQLSRGRIGTITGIYDHGPSKYLVAIEGDGHCSPDQKGRAIINFEDVAVLAEEQK